MRNTRASAAAIRALKASDRMRVATKGVAYYFFGTRRQALRDFFGQVRSGKIPIGDVGQIVTIGSGGDEYPMRTAPALYWIGLLSKADALLTLGAIGVPITGETLDQIAETDSWVWDDAPSGEQSAKQTQ